MNYVLKRTLTILMLAGSVMAVAGDKEKTAGNANLLNNSSFETCGNPGVPDYWGTYHWGMWDELGAARFDQWTKQWTLDSSEHFDGQHSIRLSNDSSGTKVPYSLFLTSCQIYLPEPGDHVFSVYMKSEKPNTPVVLEIFNGWAGRLKSQEVLVGTEWQRYEIAHKIVGDMAMASLHLKSSGVVWVDAVQFEKGTQATSFACSFLDKAPSLGEAKCASISEKPVIVGSLGDAQWEKAEKFFLKAYCGSENVGASTEVRFLADAENLYVGVKCVQSQDKISLQPKTHDQLLWAGGDVVEVFISPSTDARPYYQLVFDPAGNRYDSKSGNAGWDGIWQVKTARSADGWTAEVVIPWSNFISGQEKLSPVWRFNVCRENPYQKENLSLFPTYGPFHRRSRLGKLSGIPSDALDSNKIQISDMELKACAPDQYVAATKLFNPTDRKRTLASDVFLTVSDSYSGVSHEAKTTLPPHGSAVVEFPPFDFKASDRFAKLALTVHENGRQIASEVKNLMATPFLELSITPNLSFYTTEKQLSVTAKTTSTFSKDTSLAFDLRRDGKAIRSWKGVVGQSTTLGLQDLAVGKYDINVALLGSSGEKMTTTSHVFIKLPPAGTEVKIEYPAGALVLNGSPFLPIGVYWQNLLELNPDILNTIKQLGFNTVVPAFPVGVVPEAIKALERIQAAGLKCIPSFYIKNANAENLEALRAMMEKSKDSPAIIAWYVLDEPEYIAGDNERIAKEIYAVAKAADPYRPVYINYTSHTKFNRELPTDIHAMDIYPIPDQDIGVYPEIIKDMKSSGKAAWPWLQSSGNCYYPYNYREPTVGEFSFMTLSSLLKGASGVFYFAHLPHSAQLRKAMPELFGMISKYAPIFLSPPVAGDADAAADRKLIAAWRRDNGKTYLLVLNTTNLVMKGTINTSIMAGARQAVNLQDKSVLQIKDAKLHDDLKPFQFKIYQVEE